MVVAGLVAAAVLAVAPVWFHVLSTRRHRAKIEEAVAFIAIAVTRMTEEG